MNEIKHEYANLNKRNGILYGYCIKHKIGEIISIDPDDTIKG